MKIWQTELTQSLDTAYNLVAVNTKNIGHCPL